MLMAAGVVDIVSNQERWTGLLLVAAVSIPNESMLL
jgi:hypothetical protein